MTSLFSRIIACVLLVSFLDLNANAQATAAAEKKRLCIGPIVAIKAALQKASQAGQGETLQQTLESLDTTLIDQVNGSRKFEIVVRKDALKAILNEQEFVNEANVDEIYTLPLYDA